MSRGAVGDLAVWIVSCHPGWAAGDGLPVGQGARLAGLLWPDSPETQARHSLSQALLNLRRITGDRLASPPFFLITPKTVQLNPASDHWSDVTSLTQLLSSPASPMLEDAVALYRGPFLTGLSLPDSALFEEWALLER